MNGLTLKTVKSSVRTDITIDTLKNIKDYISAKEKHFVVAYFDNAVLFGTYENCIFKFPNGIENSLTEKIPDMKYLRRMRIFNKDEELYLWCSREQLQGRYRNDDQNHNQGEKINVVEADQLIYGTQSAQYNEGQDQYTVLTEDRGTKLVIPGVFQADNKQKRAAVKTRHYIEYLNGYQASYCDARLLDFTQLPDNGGK